MDRAPQSELVSQLLVCARLWNAACAAPVTRLGRKVVNDGAVIARLRAGSADLTTATLERFAEFLGDPANWPDAVVPQEAAQFALRVAGGERGVAGAAGRDEDVKASRHGPLNIGASAFTTTGNPQDISSASGEAA